MPPNTSKSGSASRGRGRPSNANKPPSSAARSAAATSVSGARRPAASTSTSNTVDSRGRGNSSAQRGRKRAAQEYIDDGDELRHGGGGLDGEEYDEGDDDHAMEGMDRDGRAGADEEGDEDEEEEEEDEDEDEGREKIPPELLTRILHEFFARDGTRITKDANAAVARYVDVFVREAIARAAVERQGGFLEVSLFLAITTWGQEVLLFVWTWLLTDPG